MSLYWLAIGIGLIGILVWLITSELKFFIALRKRNLLFTGLIFSGVIALAILMRIFFVDVYYIPSASMENSLLVGDKIMVSKLQYGPRLPKSPFEIPWLNLFFYMNKEARADVESDWWEYRRYNGFSKIKKNDVVVFNHPFEDKDFYIKRCVGLPGSTIKIRDGKVYENDEIESVSGIVRRYDFWYHTSSSGFQEEIRKLRVENADFRIESDSSHVSLQLTALQYQKLKEAKIIDSTRISKTSEELSSGGLGWTPNFWGPSVIPKKGVRVDLTHENLWLYEGILKRYEDVEIVKKDGQLWANGEKVTQYIFKQDYYFMMGDNRHNSIDSRYWGFVPEENIVGKAVMVLYSKKKEEDFQWKRVFQSVK